jgi:phosphoserine phosphatase
MNTILNVPAPIFVLITSTPVVAAYQYHVEAEKRAKMHRELAVAREIQMDTLPKKMPVIEGYELAGRSVPADETGGDCFDVIPLPKHRLMLLLGDATGHGIGPALSVTQVRAMLRLAARLNVDLDSAVTHINDQLAEDLAANRFVTAFFGVLDTRSHQVTHHSAGQGPLLHYHAASGEFEWLGASRMALGVLAGVAGNPARTLSMKPGDILGLMTDGVFEQENSIHEQFDVKRVEDVIREHQNESMSDLVRAIYAAVREHRNQTPQSDDVTALIVRRLPA